MLTIFATFLLFRSSGLFLDPCNPYPCKNNGKCTGTSANGLQYTCECVNGYKGLQCQTGENCKAANLFFPSALFFSV